ncbi:MAG: hypothetical protein ACE5DL_04155 [Nitrosopumilaceae archaeon]
MNQDPEEAIILATIKAGIKSFDRISKVASIPSNELETVLEKLESRNLIFVSEKKGFLGIKIEINITNKAEKNLENQVQEMREKWMQMVQLYKLEDKEKLHQNIDENKIFFKSWIFFDMLDKEIFSKMFKMAGLTMTDYISPKDMSQNIDSD